MKTTRLAILVCGLASCRCGESPTYNLAQSGIPVFVQVVSKDVGTQLDAGIYSAINAARDYNPDLDVDGLQDNMRSGLEIHIVDRDQIQCQDSRGCYIQNTFHPNQIMLSIWDDNDTCMSVSIVHEFLHYIQDFTGEEIGHYCPWFTESDSGLLRMCQSNTIEYDAIQLQLARACR
jgi:hypothetical protein